MPGIPGIGISFGAERIYDALEALGGFPEDLQLNARVIVLAMDSESHKHGFTLAQQLRQNGISADVYPEPAKFKKQIKYADQRGFPFALIIGEEERLSGQYTLKNLQTGHQSQVGIDRLISTLSQKPSASGYV